MEKEQARKIIELRNNSFSQGEIAKSLGISRCYVFACVSAHEVMLKDITAEGGVALFRGYIAQS